MYEEASLVRREVIRGAVVGTAVLVLLFASVWICGAAPTVTPGNISISGATGTGGAFKIGDTVTATWDNTASGDNNPGVISVSIDFSEFGGGAVAAANAAELWTASYVLGTGVTATNADVSVDATDGTGSSGPVFDDTDATVDTVQPTVSVDIVDASLSDSDDSSNVTFTFSEATTDFTVGDLTVVGGVISGFGGSGTSYSATFTATDGIDTTGSVTVDAASYADAAGNTGASGSDTVDIDTQNPTVTVNLVDTSLSDSDNSSSVTFSFSESVTGFDETDLTVVGGTISGLGGSGTSYSATFTATDGIDTTGSVTVDAASYTDAAGNAGASGSDTVDIDTQNPTITQIIRDDVNPTNAAQVSMQVDFSESVSGVVIGNFTPVGTGGQAPASIDSVVTAGPSAIWIIRLNTVDDATGTLTLDLDTNFSGITDAAGNELLAGRSGDESYDVDRLDPTVTVDIVDASLSDSDNSSSVTFTFSESVSGFDETDLTVVGGSISGFSGSGANYSATYTANDGIDTTGSVTVDVASYTDALGNTGASGSDTVNIDTQNPTVTVDIVDASLSDSDNSSNVTFTFTENIAGFDASDLTLVSGTIIGFSGSGSSYSATFIADDGIDTTGSITVDAGSYTDVAGNTGASGSDTVDIDTQNPTVTVNIVDASLSDSDNNSSVTFTFSENVTGFDVSDLTVVGGAISGLGGGGSSYSATFTATDGIDTTGSVTVDAGSYTDSVGNLGATGTDTVDIDTRNPTPTIATAPDPIYEGALTLTVTVTYDEAMNPATSPVVTLTGSNWGAQTAVGWSGGDTVYTCTFAHNGVEEEIPAEVASIAAGSGATDVVGNTETADDSPAFEVDTQKPTPTITTSPDPIYEGALTLTVTVTYDEAMNPATSPVVALTSAQWGAQTPVGWSGGNTVYTCTFTHNGTEEEIAAEVASIAAGSGATDAAGNAENADDSPTFVLDTRKPRATVSVDHTTVAGGTPVYEGSLMLTVTVTYDEAMNPATSPVVVLSDGSWGPQTAVGWSAGDTVYTCTFAHTGVEEPSLPAFAILVDASVVNGSGATDVAGNAEVGDTTDNPFEIDTRKPRAMVTVDHTTVAAGQPIYEGSLTLTVTVTYDESMDTGTSPTIVLSAGSWGAQAAGSWSTTTNTDDTYTTTFTHTGVEEPSLPAFTIPVSASVANGSGATDLAGNAEVGDTTDSDFEIDTRKPRATVTVNRTTVAAGQPIYEDALTLVVTVTYDEPMDTSTSPVIDLSDGSWGPQTPVGWSQTTYANDTYTAIFTHTGIEEPVTPPSPPISVIASVADGSGAKDLAGNAEVGDAIDSPFEVDTRKPEVETSVGVSGITVDTDPVYEEDLTQHVTVTFDEPMDTTVDPTVSFSHGTWTTGGGSWTSAMVWEQTFTLIDNDEEYYLLAGSVVEVDINGARDAAGNLQEPYAEVPQFDIDTVKPRIVNITSTTPDSCYIAGSNINVTMTFSEDVFLTGTVDVTLDVGGSRSVHVSLTLANPRTASGTYTVQNGENSCDLDVIEVNINGEGDLVDWAGNYERNALLLPPGSYQRNGSTHSVDQNLAANKEILVDTTIPIAVDDPEGVGDLGDSYYGSSDRVEVRLDPDGRARITVRQNTPVYIDVLSNDIELPCTEALSVHDYPELPEYGAVPDHAPSNPVRYAPDRDYVGPDEFTYRAIDACGNISPEGTVYVIVLPQLSMEDVFVNTCPGTPVGVTVTVSDLFIGEDEFEFSILQAPQHGVIVGDIRALRLASRGANTLIVEAASVELTYVPADGFIGTDTFYVLVEDEFGGSEEMAVQVTVEPCGSATRRPVVRVVQGEALVLTVPLTFANEQGVRLLSDPGGIDHASAVRTTWNEALNRHVLEVDTSGLPPGLYQWTIPLGNGETVELILEVGEDR